MTHVIKGFERTGDTDIEHLAQCLPVMQWSPNKSNPTVREPSTFSLRFCVFLESFHCGLEMQFVLQQV